MGKVNISPLLYATVASGIAWFFLWFAYDVIGNWHFLKPLTFTNLVIAICLIAFVIFGVIEQLKNLLKEMRKKMPEETFGTSQDFARFFLCSESELSVNEL